MIFMKLDEHKWYNQVSVSELLSIEILVGLQSTPVSKYKSKWLQYETRHHINDGMNC